MDTDDAERAPGDPDPRADSRPGPDIVDEALDAMTRAVASLRDQAARMINTAAMSTGPISGGVDPVPEPPAET